MRGGGSRGLDLEARRQKIRKNLSMCMDSLKTRAITNAVRMGKGIGDADHGRLNVTQGKVVREVRELAIGRKVMPHFT